jgi:hypothetical protein
MADLFCAVNVQDLQDVQDLIRHLINLETKGELTNDFNSRERKHEKIGAAR